MNRPEPAVLAHILASLLGVLASFAVPGFQPGTEALIMAFFNACAALYTAWKVNRTTMALALGVINTGFALLAGYGLSLEQGQQAAVVGLLTALVGLFISNGSEPLAKGTLSLKSGTG